MSKEIIINIIMLSVYICVPLWFLVYTTRKYGKLISISATAKHLRKDGNSILFYGFIAFGVCFPAGYLGQSWLSIIAASLLFLIGIITGYNPNLNNYKGQHTVHFIAVLIAIALILTDMILVNLWYSFPVGASLAYTSYVSLTKERYYVRKAEIAIMMAVGYYFLMERILIPLFNA